MTGPPMTGVHVEHYPKEVILFLEELWGDGFLSPGGPEEVECLMAAAQCARAQLPASTLRLLLQRTRTPRNAESRNAPQRGSQVGLPMRD